MNVAIDASRNRSGGAIVHMVEILKNFNFAETSINELHIWAPIEIIESLKEHKLESNIFIHHDAILQKNIFYKLVWQRYFFKSLLKKYNVDVLFNASASSVFSSKNIKIVTICQDMLPFEIEEKKRFSIGFMRLRLEILYHVYKRCLERSSKVIFLSKYAQRQVSKYCRISHSKVISHGIDKSFKGISKGIIPTRIDHIKASYVSNALPYKHHNKLIEAVSELRKYNINITIDLIGAGTGPESKKIIKKARSIDKKSDFIFIHQLQSKADVQRILSESNLFIFASTCENLPITLLEGVGAGLLIVSSHYGPMKEVLGENVCYFDPLKPQTIVEAIKATLDLSLEIKRKNLSNLEEIADHFSWQKCTRETFKYIIDR